MVAPLTDLLKGANKHEKEGKPLLRGRLAPAAENALMLTFHLNGPSKLLQRSSKSTLL
jgi:hypothetical protein